MSVSGSSLRRRAPYGSASAAHEEGDGDPSTSKTFVESDADGNVQVYLFTSAPPAELYCPLTRKILDDPLLTPQGNTFSAKAIRSHVRASKTCPLTGQPLTESQLQPNLFARTLVEELEVHCPYGVRMGEGGTWEEDEDGCPDTYKLALRKAKLKACKYRPVKCPYGGRKCGLIPRLDLEYHVQEECAFLHRRDGKKGRDDDETEDDTDNLELLTVLLAWSLLLFGLFQTHFFGRLMKEASYHLSLLMGIPISLVFIAIIAEYVINSRPSSEESEYEVVEADD